MSCITLLNAVAVNLKIDGLVDQEYKVDTHRDDKEQSVQRQAAQLRTRPVSDQGFIPSGEEMSDKTQEDRHNEKEKLKTLDTKRNPDPQNHNHLNQTIIILKSDALNDGKFGVNDLTTTAAPAKRRKNREHERPKLVPSIKDYVSYSEENIPNPDKTVDRIKISRINQNSGQSIRFDDQLVHNRGKDNITIGRYGKNTGKTPHKGYVYINEQADRYQTDDEDHQSKINHSQNSDQDSNGSDQRTSGKGNKPTEATTEETHNIYIDAHQIRQNANVTNFINQLYKRTLKVLDVAKNKSENYYFRKEFDMLSRNYKDKFNEYIKMTEKQTIKTRLGTQKVILNSIDLSNNILTRLINYMMADMDKKGVLRNNADAPKILREEIEKAQTTEFYHACKMFGICRSEYGFSKFLIDLIDIQLKMANNKFFISYNAFTEVLKNTQFDFLNNNTSILLGKFVNRMELMQGTYVKAMFIIAKNTIVNRNKPLLAGNNNEKRISSSLAFSEIMNVVEQHIPGNDANLYEWGDIRQELQDYSDDKKNDAVNVWESLAAHIKKSLNEVDKQCKGILNDKLSYLLS